MILTKLIGASTGAKLAGFNWNSSLGIGSAMVSRGEVALIIAAIGFEANLLTQEMFAVVIGYNDCYPSNDEIVLYSS